MENYIIDSATMDEMEKLIRDLKRHYDEADEAIQRQLIQEVTIVHRMLERMSTNAVSSDGKSMQVKKDNLRIFICFTNTMCEYFYQELSDEAVQWKELKSKLNALLEK